MTATGTWKVVDNDSIEGEEAPARVWRDSEAACDAWIEECIGRHPNMVVMSYVAEGPLAPTPLPWAVVDRGAPAGEGRILERFADEREAKEYVDMEERYSLLKAVRPHYGIAHGSALDEVLEAPPTALAEGGHVRVGGTEARGTWPALENFEEHTVGRRIETPWGMVEATAYPTGHVVVAAGMPRITRTTPIPVAGSQAWHSVAFEAVLSMKGDEATILGVRKTVRDGLPETADAKIRNLADRTVFSTVRAAAQVMATEYPRDRLEALERYHVHGVASAEERIRKAREEIERAQAALERSGVDLAETRAALEAAGPAAEASFRP